MEAVDAGDMPLSAVIDRLLSPDGLRELIGTYRAACFVLARPILVPNFFERLIGNVGTIDATLRDHVAFVVFHGRNTSLITPPDPDRYRHGRNDNLPRPDGPTGADLRYHIDGLSFSDGRTIFSHQLSGWRPRFDEAMMARIRSGDAELPLAAIASASERATNILMERFGVAEAQLPALLFVDGGLSRRHVLVPLDQADPMRSLYTNVLGPLSDEFRRIGSYWERTDRLRLVAGRIGRIAEARTGVAKAQVALANAQAAVTEAAAPGDTNAETIAAARAEVAALEVIDAAFAIATSLDQRLAAIPADAPVQEAIIAIGEEMAAAERAHKALSSREDSDAHREEIIALRSKVHRLRGEIGKLCKDYRDRIAAKLARLGEDPLQRVPARLIERRTETQARLDRATHLLARLESDETTFLEESARLAPEAERLAAPLRASGYDQAFLNRERPDTISVVQSLIARKLIRTGTKDDEAGKSVLEGPWTKGGVVLGAIALIFTAIGLIFTAIQVYPNLFQATSPPAPAVAAPAPVVRRPHAPAAPKVPARFKVTVVDTDRPTRKQIHDLLSGDARARVNPLGQVDEGWIKLAQDIGCDRPDVVVAHLHAFRNLKGDADGEDFLFSGLRDIAARSSGTRFVLYSATFGQATPPAPGERRVRIVTVERATLLARMAGIVARITHHDAAKSDYAAMLANMTFVAWPLPGQFGEPNRIDLKDEVATAGKAYGGAAGPPSNLCTDDRVSSRSGL